LSKWPLIGDPTLAVDGDTFGDLDAEPLGAGAACLQSLEQLRMAGNAGAAPDELNFRTLVNIQSWRKNAALNRPDMEPPIMTARRFRRKTALSVRLIVIKRHTAGLAGHGGHD